MHDVLVIGGGPAGLSAAVTCVNDGLDTLLVSQDLGGKANLHLQLPFLERHYSIPGVEVVDRLSAQIHERESSRTYEHAERLEAQGSSFVLHTREGGDHEARTVILATGARPRLLGVPGAREYMMRGLCYSAVSYAPVFHNRVAAVVGDGELALRSALELARHGRLVYLLLPAHTGLDSALGMRVREAAHVTVLRGYRVIEVLGDEYARSLRIGGDGEERFLPIDGIFVEYELLPNSELVRGLAALDPAGRVRIDGRNRTSCAGLFAAGDVTNIYRERILVAVGEGVKAALSISDHLLYLETDRWGARSGDLNDGNGKWHPGSSPT